jgi:hypothetical protein
VDPAKLLKTIEEKLDEQNMDKEKTEKEFGLFLKNRVEKLTRN